jgi:hypothetical protein
MRFKESLALDHMINERRNSLVREASELKLDKRAQALAVLIEARDKLDAIGAQTEPVDRRYHEKFVGTDEQGRKIRPRRRRALRRQHNVDDLQRRYESRIGDIDVTIPHSAEFGKTLRKELRRSTTVIPEDCKSC